MRRPNIYIHTLIHGYVEAFEAKVEMELIQQLRDLEVRMHVCAVPKSDNYLVFFQIPDFGRYQKLLQSVGKILVVFQKKPYVKPQSELEPGEKPARDTASG